VKRQNFTDAVVLGMGGSSLGPEVLAKTFAKKSGFPKLHVLDSTDPAQVRTVDTAVSDLAAGIDKGPLQGIPIGVKDIIATKDSPTSAIFPSRSGRRAKSSPKSCAIKRPASSSSPRP